jgi:ubiquinone/menaquinone biosynthesis C-methylase UbiE
VTAIEAAAALPRAAEAGPYDQLSPSERYIHRTRDEALLALLRRHGVASLGGRRVLELGCGEGSFLRSLLSYGAEPDLLEGVDLRPGRVAAARRLVPGARLSAADGAALPYRDGVFDVVFAFTFFSSVTGPAPRRRAATEALRVLRAGGLLIVYDFWINPLNPRVRPLGAAELFALVAPRRVEMERVTLAPPIVRALGGRRALCRPLERLPLLRTHLLAAVTKES